MPWTDLALHLLALIVYPGALLMLVAGAAAEVAAAAVLDRSAPGPAIGALLPLLDLAARPSTPVLAAALLEVLAATQLAVPFNPVPAVERNLLVAAIALVAAAWLGWAPSWTAPARRRLLVVQACWLVALLAPALVSETLRPQALGAVIVPAQLPLKALSALLAVVCLPALLPLPPGPVAEAAPARLLRWLPYCGLLASVLVPPGPDDPSGLLRFFAATAVVAGAALGLAALAARRPGAGALWSRLPPALAAVVLVLAAATPLVT